MRTSIPIALLSTLSVTACGGRVEPLIDDDAFVPVVDAGTDTTVPARDSAAADTFVFDSRPPVPDVGSDTGETCERCIDRACRAEATACAAKPRCVRGVDCLNGCAGPDGRIEPDCANRCISGASGDLDDFVECLVLRCRRPCGLP